MQTALERLRELKATSRSFHVAAEMLTPAIALQPPSLVKLVEVDWDQGAADVLAVLARAEQPVPHSQIVKELCQSHGHSKEAAKAAIATCQSQGWIGHDLKDGYVLVGTLQPAA